MRGWLQELLPNTIADVLHETFVWQHDEIQRELDKLVVKAHDDLYDLNTEFLINKTKQTCSPQIPQYSS